MYRKNIRLKYLSECVISNSKVTSRSSVKYEQSDVCNIAQKPLMVMNFNNFSFLCCNGEEADNAIDSRVTRLFCGKGQQLKRLNLLSNHF